ncbi:hypothetical protein EVA_06150 [gut metagenome]|uniref:Uncharacterized protein n=1 Tax=gut metagenome TaxID=749906 RepID=J9GY69_9ZZZZ
MTILQHINNRLSNRVIIRRETSHIRILHQHFGRTFHRHTTILSRSHHTRILLLVIH